MALSVCGIGRDCSRVDRVTNHLQEELGRLKRVADLMATAHSVERDRYETWSSSLTISSLLISVILLSLVLVAEDFVQRTTGIEPDVFKWLRAGAAATNFAIVVIGLSWRPTAKAALHDQAVRHYVKAKHQIRQLEADAGNLSKQAVTLVEEQYLEDHDLPRIAERRFLRLKQWHLQKVAASQELDKNPHESLRSIRKRLRRAIQACKDQERS